MDIPNAIVTLEEIRDVVATCDKIDYCDKCDEKTKERCLALSNDLVYEAVDIALDILRGQPL